MSSMLQHIFIHQLLPFFIMDGLQIPGIPGLFTGVLFCSALRLVDRPIHVHVHNT